MTICVAQVRNELFRKLFRYFFNISLLVHSHYPKSNALLFFFTAYLLAGIMLLGLVARPSRTAIVKSDFSLRQIHKMSGGPIETSIRTKISKALSPAHLEVINESTMHNVPPGSETHFKVVVVAEGFEGKTPLQRHRIVNQLLEDDLNNGVHALSIVTRTPKQWEESSKEVEPSPNCRGGFGK